MSKISNRRKTHKCAKCGKAYDRKNRLDLHVRSEHHVAKKTNSGLKRSNETIDLEEDSANDEVNSGKKTKLVKMIECSACESRFSNTQLLRSHFLRTHTMGIKVDMMASNNKRRPNIAKAAAKSGMEEEEEDVVPMEITNAWLDTRPEEIDLEVIEVDDSEVAEDMFILPKKKKKEKSNDKLNLLEMMPGQPIYEKTPLKRAKTKTIDKAMVDMTKDIRNKAVKDGKSEKKDNSTEDATSEDKKTICDLRARLSSVYDRLEAREKASLERAWTELDRIRKERRQIGV